MLRESPRPLQEAYGLAVLDLDGVVYIGTDAVPGAATALPAARAAGMALAYVTNNAARPPRVVAGHLRELGIPAADEDVVTSAQAAAHLLAERLPAGSPVFVIGGQGLVEALAEQGLRPTQDVADEPVAVVSGYHRDLRWGTVSDGAILVRRGLPWVAANTDRSVPTPLGPGPGNGMLVDLVSRFTGREPVVAGKPQAPLFEETLRRVAGGATAVTGLRPLVAGLRPLVVGDRLDTDIEGAATVGWDSLLVLTGVTGLPELAAAPPPLRPTYLAVDLRGLAEPHPVPRRATDGGHRCGGWEAAVVAGRLEVSGGGAAGDWWRVAAAAAWAHLDDTGEPADVSGAEVPGTVSWSEPRARAEEIP